MIDTKPEAPLGLSRDPDHRYTWRDEFGTIANLASVTKVISILEKPGLAPAAARIVAGYATTQLEDVARLTQAVGIPEAIKKLAGMPRAEWAAKADLGSRVHTLAELVMRGREIAPAPDEAPFIEGLYRFIDDAKPIPLALEEMVAYEDEVGLAYAGTFDAILAMASGRWLVDVKTGKDLYPDIALQLAGYGYASFIGRPGTTARYELPAVDFYAVLHLRPELPKGYEFVPYRVGRPEWLAFMALLDTYSWIRSPKPKKEALVL